MTKIHNEIYKYKYPNTPPKAEIISQRAGTSLEALTHKIHNWHRMTLENALT